MSEIDQEFVEYIVKALVGEPDKVEIKRSIDEKGVLLELTVAQEDLGRVIGKRGNTAQSIRTLLRALGTKNDARYNLKIIDPEGDSRPPRREREDRSDQSSGGSYQQSSAPVDDYQSVQSVSEDPVSSEQPVSDGASQWAHLSSSSDDSTDASVADEPSTNDDQQEDVQETNSVVEKTRQELADLDGLDI